MPTTTTAKKAPAKKAKVFSDAEMEAMQDVLAFQASASSLARQVDGYSMAILEVLEGGERAVERWPAAPEKDPEPAGAR